MQQPQSWSVRKGLPRLISAASLLAAVASSSCHDEPAIAEMSYVCGEQPLPEDAPGAPRCGAADTAAGELPPEPFGAGANWPPPIPTDPACIVVAQRPTPPEGQVLPEPVGDIDTLDTARIQAALDHCKNSMVLLKADGDNTAFLSANLRIDSTILWVDKGVTVFMTRNPDLMQKTGNCGVLGINDSGACLEWITVRGISPGIIGEGILDGQGGEPLVGKDYSWWNMSYALREIDGSIGNPTLINTVNTTTGFLLYKITLHNSAKFHVKLTSFPNDGTDGTCTTPGKGFIVWGVTVLTPSKWFNSKGEQLTPSWARNTDGIDPGANNIAYCGVIACSTVSTGDDQIAIKGGHWVEELRIAHMHFGTGHGMSIGSETYGLFTSTAGVQHVGVQKVKIWDLTIDADSRAVGHEAHASDFNGIRVKSDTSRGGLVDQISYTDVCMRDMVNAILISTAYNPLFAGDYVPDFRRLTFNNVRHVTCNALGQPTVTVEGFNKTLPVGPVTFNNVIIDNFGQQAVAAEFANITLGPGPVNFRPAGFEVNVDNQIKNADPPKECIFPKLPAPARPDGWKN
jgi:polygalacturonase